jgi:hypothetical protein
MKDLPTVDELNTLLAGTSNSGAPGDSPFELTVYTAAELCALPDPDTSDYLLGAFVIRGARTIIVGDTGHGKTTLALSMLRAILAGEELIGERGSGAVPCSLSTPSKALAQSSGNCAKCNSTAATT